MRDIIIILDISIDIIFVPDSALLSFSKNRSSEIMANLGLYFNACSINRSTLVFAVRRYGANKSGYSDKISNVCRPIDPVLPNMAICFLLFTG